MSETSATGTTSANSGTTTSGTTTSTVPNGATISGTTASGTVDTTDNLPTYASLAARVTALEQQLVDMAAKPASSTVAQLAPNDRAALDEVRRVFALG